MMKKRHIIALAIVSICFVYSQFRYSAVPVEFDKQSPYKFDIQIEPWHEFTLCNTLIHYDFLTKRGDISFLITDGTKPELLLIKVPSNLSITNISIKNESIELKEGIDFIRENNSDNFQNIVELENFKDGIKDYGVLIEFEGELIPNAEFKIDFKVKQAFPAYKNEFIDFNIGEYSCSSPENCLSSDKLNRYRYYWKSGRERGLIVAIERDEEKSNLLSESFNLILEPSKTMLEEKQNWNQYRFLFFGMLIGSIITLILKYPTQNPKQLRKKL